MHLLIHRFPRTWRAAAVALFVLTVRGTAAQASQSQKVYYIGNSLTEGINLPAVTHFASSRGNLHDPGKHMRTGASLHFIWNNPNDASAASIPPYGLYQNALTNHVWDAVSIQPYTKLIEGADGDLAMSSNFINLALQNSPNAQFYIFSHHPARPGGVIDYDAAWLRPYTGLNDGTYDTRDFYNRLVNELRTAFPALAKPILMVPLGDVFLELHERMEDGLIAGFTDIQQFYADNEHANAFGSYTTAATYYATLYKDDPIGLDHAQFGVTDPALAAAIQDAVWDVVSVHPYSGVPEPGVATLIGIAGAALLVRRRRA
jgi:hypothetical protein